jgi:drug/metabolite transporter (DMT)-like permease
VDRRRTALVLLLLFVGCLGVAIVLSGSRPGLQQGSAPTVAAFLGYLFALVAAVLLIAPAAGAQGDTRTLGGVILAALVVLVLLDLFVPQGPDIGAGFVQLICEVVILVATVRLALGVAADRRAP